MARWSRAKLVALLIVPLLLSGSVPVCGQSTAGDLAAAAPLGASCCEVCRKGKACGDTCIARERTCRKPPGWACDR